MPAPVPAAEGPLHLRIHGRVQGVCFRETMVEEATRLEVRGWVRNCPDGTVEAVVEGARHARAALLAWAHRGPAAARVTRVESRDATADEAASVGRGFVRLPSAL